MMYRITDPVSAVKGVGGQSAEQFSEKSLRNILDLLLFLPLRYEIYSSADFLKKTLKKYFQKQKLPKQKFAKISSAFVQNYSTIANTTKVDFSLVEQKSPME